MKLFLLLELQYRGDFVLMVHIRVCVWIQYSFHSCYHPNDN